MAPVFVHSLNQFRNPGSTTTSYVCGVIYIHKDFCLKTAGVLEKALVGVRRFQFCQYLVVTLDKLLNGSIDNKKSFDRHLQKILKLLNMSVDDLMFYHSAPVKAVTAIVFSQNAPVDHEMSETAKKQYDLLLDVIDLCAIYY